MLTIKQANALIGRVVRKEELNYTVTSASTLGDVCVWDPTKQELIYFDSQETFENWAYGTPVSAAALEKEEKNG
jgi:hypothetical protein